MGPIATAALIALVVVLVVLVGLRVAERFHWRPVDRLADFISYGPTPASSVSSAASSSSASSSSPADMDDD